MGAYNKNQNLERVQLMSTLEDHKLMNYYLPELVKPNYTSSYLMFQTERSPGREKKILKIKFD